MRLAVLADIHGNRPALDAVLADLDRRGGADQLINLGDCASGPLWPAETLERLIPLGAITVRGNHDRAVATLAAAAMGPSDREAHDALAPEARAWLGGLPATAAPAPGVLAFHGTPDRDDRYLLDAVVGGGLVRDRSGAIAARLGDVGPARLVLCGHSHRADLVRLPGGVLVLNPGSVGCPAYRDTDDPAHVSQAGSPHARYALVELDQDPAEARVAFLAVAYDAERAARRAKDRGRPDWGHALRTGFMPA